MIEKNFLFCEVDLDRKLRERQQRVSNVVDQIPKDQFLISSDQEIVDHVVADLIVEPIVLCEERMTMAQNETKVDVSHDPMRVSYRRNMGPLEIPGTKVDIDIPFTGEEWIFRCRTNVWSSVFPRGNVKRGRLRMTIKLPHDVDPSAFQNEYEREIGVIREYVGYSRKQVLDNNNGLPNLVQQAVRNRRERLSRHDNIAACLIYHWPPILGHRPLSP